MSAADDHFAPDLPDELARVASPDARVRQIASGFRFIEGPVWVKDRLLFSDIPQSKIFSWSPTDGLNVYREQSHGANGNALDADGHLFSCEHQSRLVSTTEPALGGERRIFVERFDHDGSKVRFNSPNDVVIHPTRGEVYFTDPYWGLPGDRREELMEYGKDQCWVFRCDPDGGNCRPIVKDFKRPNGLAFTPDGKELYIGDDQEKHVRRFGFSDVGDLVGGDVFCEIDNGVPDGMKVDTDGRLYCTAGDGVHVFLPDGRRAGKILCNEGPANCAFGGDANRTLYMTARTGLYAVDLLAQGV